MSNANFKQAGANTAMTRILAISGSLRSHSSNTALLEAAALVAPQGVEITVYGGVGNLPHFNPDLEDMESPTVSEYRRQLQKADGVLISSPEYAHGVPGVMKNALDWVVGSGELVNKPVALLNASLRSTYAQASLLETLTVMSARVIPQACITFPHWDKTLDAAGIASHAQISRLLRESLDELIRAIRREEAQSPA
jgi:NAD(P)H-dependent FMN reductase